MNTTIQAITDSLQRLQMVYIEMLAVADSKKQAIIQNDVDTVVQPLNRESKGMKEIERLNGTAWKSRYIFCRVGELSRSWS